MFLDFLTVRLHLLSSVRGPVLNMGETWGEHNLCLTILTVRWVTLLYNGKGYWRKMLVLNFPVTVFRVRPAFEIMGKTRLDFRNSLDYFNIALPGSSRCNKWIIAPQILKVGCVTNSVQDKFENVGLLFLGVIRKSYKIFILFVLFW